MSIQAGKENEWKWEEYWNGLRAQGKYLLVKANARAQAGAWPTGSCRAADAQSHGDLRLCPRAFFEQLPAR